MAPAYPRPWCDNRTARDSRVMDGAWPVNWDDQRRGDACAMCEGSGEDDKPGGLRIFDGEWCDAYLGRWPVRRGYAYVVWKGRHVAEPTELSADEARGFWREVTRVASAVERRYQPMK